MAGRRPGRVFGFLAAGFFTCACIFSGFLVPGLCEQAFSRASDVHSAPVDDTAGGMDTKGCECSADMACRCGMDAAGGSDPVTPVPDDGTGSGIEGGEQAAPVGPEGVIVEPADGVDRPIYGRG